MTDLPAPPQRLPALPVPPVPRAVSDKAKTWGIVSIVCGVLGLALLPIVFGPIALVAGIVAISSGYRPAWAGIALGAVQIVIVVVALAKVSEALNAL